ncbi:MAG: Nif3-like dinuclear metal center hexameric protein [Myxococcales bacterium]|jgi:dinuclear metal center YbgI/SA1388 family protein|nr:MAG: Nif3-like dinuclear metal center hexameric protein [Myxococcales bacterium]
MTELATLVSTLDALLESARFDDYCPNGLQIEGRAQVRTLVSGVTACEALLDAAIERGADAVLVHHGYFWRGERATITGMRRRRIGKLLGADISLIAYHLPLDAHRELGNNAQLALRLGLVATDVMNADGVGSVGRLDAPLTGAELGERIEHALGRTPLHVPGPGGGSGPIESVAWCTGAAQGMIDRAADLGVDAYITGEASEQTVHVARERGLHFFAAGHHATERFGVQAVGDHLAEKFGIRHEFVDVENPV